MSAPITTNAAHEAYPHDEEKVGHGSDSEVLNSPNSSRLNISKKTKGLSGVGLVFACGASLFSDGYVNAISGTTNTIITSYIYADYDADELSRFTTLFPSLAFVGTVVGMLSFGYLSDMIGRRYGMLICSAGLIVFSILSAGAWGAGGSTSGLFSALIAYRFLAGIFIGGEYPCSSVAAAENTEQPNIKKNQQSALFVLATNTCIDIGFVVASFVPLVLVWICGQNHLTPVWRISLGLGAIPPLSLLYLRTKMHEPASYAKGAIKKNLPWWLIIKTYWWRLLLVSGVWFCYDFVAYPAGLYASYFTAELFTDPSLKTSLAFGIALNAFYLPGTFIGAAVVDYLGPKRTMLIFLALQAIFGFALSGAFGYFRAHVAGLIVMYGIFIAAGEAGPGNNLGLLASKAIGPSAVRGRLYGIAAAVGKIGAFVGTYCYTPLQNRFPEDSNLYYAAPFYVGSGLAVLAFLMVCLIPAVEVDGVAKLDREFLELLERHGYDMSNVGLKDASSPPGRLSEDPQPGQEGLHKHDSA